jgi:hypothetical protein
MSMQTQAGAEQVASFDSLDRAARAAAHLVELDYDPGDVAIAPQEFEVAVDETLGWQLIEGGKNGALVGIAVVGSAALLLAVGWEALTTSVLPTVGAAAVVGAVIGLVAALARHRRESLTAFGPSAAHLVPRRFGILVRRGADRAGNDLARWWEPTPRPMVGRRSRQRA